LAFAKSTFLDYIDSDRNQADANEAIAKIVAPCGG
jgi:hypothetical protein